MSGYEVRREGVLAKKDWYGFHRESGKERRTGRNEKRTSVARRHVQDLGPIWLAPPVKHDVIASFLSQLSTLIWAWP